MVAAEEAECASGCLSLRVTRRAFLPEASNRSKRHPFLIFLDGDVTQLRARLQSRIAFDLIDCVSFDPRTRGVFLN
jgi:hypothetical protein